MRPAAVACPGPMTAPRVPATRATGDAQTARLADVGPGHVVVAEQRRRLRPQRGPLERREHGSQRLGGHAASGSAIAATSTRSASTLRPCPLPATAQAAAVSRDETTATGLRRMVVSWRGEHGLAGRRTIVRRRRAASEHANVSVATTFEGVRPNVARRPRLRRACYPVRPACAARQTVQIRARFDVREARLRHQPPHVVGLVPAVLERAATRTDAAARHR